MTDPRPIIEMLIFAGLALGSGSFLFIAAVMVNADRREKQRKRDYRKREDVV